MRVDREDTDKTRSLEGKDEDLLVWACRGYISSIMRMMVGEGSMPRDKAEYTRIHFHRTITDLILGHLKYDSELKETVKPKLNSTCHALQTVIDFPIPDPRGYGSFSEDPENIRENYYKISNRKGRELAEYLKKEYCGKTLEDFEDGEENND